MERMKELIKKIKEADKAYYEDNNPIMLDYEYDKLIDELAKLEKETGIILDDSPTKNVSGNASGDFIKVEHRYPMLSLNKTKLPEDLKNFLGNEEGALTYKLDGLTMVLYYEDYKLKRLVTRGNGLIGEDVTRNIELFEDIPMTISNKILPPDAVIRGEALMSYDNFNMINEEMEEAYKNPRNLASGLLRSKTVKQKGVLNFLTYSIENNIEKDYINVLSILKEEGFDVVPSYPELITKENIDKAIPYMAPENIKFPVDGLVLRMNDYKKVEELGTTAKFPRYAMAFKWKDELVETKIKDIVWSVARTGVITPVAVFKPVEIEGTIVEKASLHNLSTFLSFKLGVGDRVNVYKANMIIPQLLENLDKTGTCSIPTVCPSCGHEVHREAGKLDGVINLVCTNKHCPAQNVSNFVLFASNEGFAIDGLSEKTIELFIEEGLIKDYKDIFSLKDHKEKIISLPLFGLKSYNNLISAIEKSKTISADKFIRSLGIQSIGSSVAASIFKGRNNEETLKKLLNSNKKELMTEFGLGDKSSDKFLLYIKENKDTVIKDLLDIVAIKSLDEKIGNKLNGQSFCITGKLNTISRKELEKLIKGNGGNVQSAVSSNTDYLINNDKTSGSSKNKKAKELGTSIINEEEALKLIK